MHINIAPNVRLDAKKSVTDTEAALAKKGNGKTHIAQVYAEEILELNIAPIVAIDPTDAWWGLRSSASGKRKGYPVAVFGGDHGDVKIEPDGGAELAEAIVNERFSAVICTETLSESGEIRFISDFLSTLYRKNRKPLKLFCDEVDMYAPQIPRTPQESKALGAMQNIVRRGRGKGLGCMMISQRPAVVNKDVLSMVFTLFLLGMDHNLDLEQIERWTKRRGKAAALANPFIQEMLEMLPEAQPGDAWVLSPTKKLYERFRARAKHTFDSGKTPEIDDDVVEPKVLAPIDIKRLGERIAAAVERQKAEDPKFLKAEVARLKKANDMLEVGAEALRVANAQKPATVSGKAKTIEREVVKAPMLKRIETAITAGGALVERWDLVRDRSAAQEDAKHKALLDVQAKADTHFAGLRTQLADLGKVIASTRTPAPGAQMTHRATYDHAAKKVIEHRPPPPPRKPNGSVATVMNGHSAKVTAGDTSLTGPQKVLLSTLSWWAAMGHNAPSRAQIAGKAGWRARGSNLRNRLSELHALGLVEYPAASTVSLTAAGATASPAANRNETLHDSIRDALTGPQKVLFEELLGTGPLGRDSLADRVDWEPNGSNLRNRLSELCAMEIVEYPTRGHVRLQQWVTE